MELARTANGLPLLVKLGFIVAVVVLGYLIYKLVMTKPGCGKFSKEWRMMTLEQQNNQGFTDIPDLSQCLDIYDPDTNLLFGEFKMTVSKDDKNRVKAVSSDNSMNVNVMYGPIEDMVTLTVISQKPLPRVVNLVALQSDIQLNEPNFSNENGIVSFTLYLNLNDIPKKPVEILATLGIVPAFNLGPQA